MKKQAFAKFARKSVATVAAAVLALSMFGCAGGQVAQQAQEESAVSEEIEETATALASASDVELTIKAGAATLVQGSRDTYSFPHLTVETTNPNRPIKSITVQFTSAITDTDEIYLTDSGNFKVLDTTKHGNKSVNNPSGCSAEDWANYLRDHLTIKLSDEETAKSLRMIASFDPTYRILDYNAANGHYYEVAKDTAGNDVVCNWSSALRLSQAAHTTYLGMQGYLVTITDQQEHDFAYSLVKTDSWMGGTCDLNYAGFGKDWAKSCPTYDESDSTRWARANQIFFSGDYAMYYWVCGPEAGKEIGGAKLKYAPHADNEYWRTTDPATGKPMFMNFNPALQPDGAGGREMYIQFNSTYLGLWNDLPDTSVLKYVIEYGGLPGEDPESLANANVDVFVKVDINLDPTGQTITTEVNNTTVGTPAVVKENVNGDETIALHDKQGKPILDDDGKVVTSPVTRTYWVKDDTATGGWRELGPKDPLLDPATGVPCHAGTYRVQSHAQFGERADGTELPYKSDPTTFVIRPKTLLPVIEKPYDGTATYSVDKLDVSDQILQGADVQMTAGKEVVFNDFSVADAKEAYLTGAAITGKDAADYALPATTDDGKFITTGKIVPRELEVQAIATVNWGLAGQELKDGAGNLIEYKNDLAVHKDGEWAKNELAPRDAIDGDVTKTILGAVDYTALAGTTELNKTNPVVGHYGVVAHFANVNPAGSTAADAGKDVATLSMMADETTDPNAEGAGADKKDESSAAKTYGVIKKAASAGEVDQIKGEPMGGGRYDLGNYIMVLKDAGVVVTDNPLNEDGYDSATKFLGDTVNEKVDPDAKPLTQQEVLDLVKELFGSELPSGNPTLMITDKDGKVVETIDPSKIGSYAIVATYPNPDGEDTVVRVGYNVLQNDPIVEKQSIKVKAHEGADPLTKDNIKKVAENVMDDWIPKGVNPTIIITDEEGKQVSEIPMDKPGTYKATLTYIDDDGVVRQVVLDYTVDPDQEEEVIEDLRKPISDEGPMTKKDIYDDIMERYSPEIIPANVEDYEITIVGPNGPVEEIDPSVPGTYTVTMTYTDEHGNIHTVKTTYTFFDPAEGMDRQAQGTDPSTGDGDGDGIDRLAGGTDPSTGSDFNSGASGYKGWDNNSGSKGFADRLLAQTGDPVFWVICGVVVVAVAAGIVLVVARKKNKKQQ